MRGALAARPEPEAGWARAGRGPASFPRRRLEPGRRGAMARAGEMLPALLSLLLLARPPALGRPPRLREPRAGEARDGAGDPGRASRVPAPASCCSSRQGGEFSWQQQPPDRTEKMGKNL